MDYIKKIFKSLLYVIVITLISVFILTLLNYFNLMSYKVLNIAKYIIFIISILIGSYKFGYKSKNKGLIEGIKFGLIVIVILLLFNYLVFNMPFNIKAIIYYSIILATSIFASVLGKNRKN